MQRGSNIGGGGAQDGLMLPAFPVQISILLSNVILIDGMQVNSLHEQCIQSRVARCIVWVVLVVPRSCQVNALLLENVTHGVGRAVDAGPVLIGSVGRNQDATVEAEVRIAIRFQVSFRRLHRVVAVLAGT